MEKNPVIEVLQKARVQELFAITQYISFHEQLEYFGYSKLADGMKDIAITEMHHSGALGSRIKLLAEEPADLFTEEVAKPTCALNIFNAAAELEKASISDYNYFIHTCNEHKDFISADILLGILKEEQQHFDYFMKTASLIETLGAPFLTSQSSALISSIKQNS